MFEEKFSQHLRNLFDVGKVDAKILSLKYKDMRTQKVMFRKFISDIKDYSTTVPSQTYPG